MKDREQDERHRHQPARQGVSPTRKHLAPAEGHGVRSQVQGKRQHPQERRRGHVRGKPECHAVEEGTRQQRKDQHTQGHVRQQGNIASRVHRSGAPSQTENGSVAEFSWLRFATRHACRQRGCCPSRMAAAQDEYQEQQPEKRKEGSPQPNLQGNAKEGLQDKGIDEQDADRTPVGYGVQHIRVRAVPLGPRKPRRCQRRQHRYRQAGGAVIEGKGAEQPQSGKHRARLGWRFTERRRNAAQKPGHRHHPQGGEPYHLLEYSQLSHHQVGKQVAGEQHGLEEQHRRVPHQRRPADRRKQAAYRHRLHPEHQRGRHEHRQAVQRHRRRGGRPKPSHVARCPRRRAHQSHTDRATG